MFRVVKVVMMFMVVSGHGVQEGRGVHGGQWPRCSGWLRWSWWSGRSRWSGFLSFFCVSPMLSRSHNHQCIVLSFCVKSEIAFY